MAEEYTLEARWSFMKKLVIGIVLGFLLSSGAVSLVMYLNAPPPPPETYRVVKSARSVSGGLVIWYENKSGEIVRDHYDFDGFNCKESKDGEWYVTHRTGLDIIHMPKSHFNEWLP